MWVSARCCFYAAANRRVLVHCYANKAKYEYRPLCSKASRSGFDDYGSVRTSFDPVIPEKFNFAADVIDVWARKEKDGYRNASNPALWFVPEIGQEVKWNFQTLEYESKRVANALQEQCRINRGDNVIVMLPKLPEFWLVNIAAIRIGAVLSPGSMMLTKKDLAHRLSVFSPSCIIAHESVVDLIDEVSASFPTLKSKVIVAPSKARGKKDWIDFHQIQNAASDNHKCADTRSDESMAVFFTSGTTGQPKMAEHSHSSYGIGHLVTGKFFLDLTPETVMWSLSDTGWAKTAYSGIFGPWACGSCAFVHGMPRFNARTTLQVLSKFPVDTFCSAPMGYRSMLQEDLANHNFLKLSHCISAAEPLCPEIIDAWKAATGLQLYDGYGQTETVLIIGMFKCLEYKAGSMGKPAPGMDVVILDKNQNEVGPGINGEIALKKRNGSILGAFKGYRNEPEKTNKKVTDKYLLTGDVGYYDKDGYYWFVGRNDDIINSAGYRIGPFEVESALLEHPAVLEVAVISSPDASRGEVVKAFIVLKDAYLDKPETILIKQLQEHAKKITAPYKYPRKIEFVTELPKTTSGKIKRNELKQREWQKCK
ncbi:hypothetical protein JTE90_011904 [Oedothorax gibbosus]|uniref:medium-chain acyl-CoA ligase n=1 Tax=Oedothorax gibbosus TaxID=931172 RepID=A0AAV6V2T4_9ARAC|nr:hypothetical protein JTE90_011904 [Oedothorax gibbosus]